MINSTKLDSNIIGSTPRIFSEKKNNVLLIKKPLMIDLII
jgi:hypothetical protein